MQVAVSGRRQSSRRCATGASAVRPRGDLAGHLLVHGCASVERSRSGFSRRAPGFPASPNTVYFTLLSQRAGEPMQDHQPFRHTGRCNQLHGRPRCSSPSLGLPGPRRLSRDCRWRGGDAQTAARCSGHQPSTSKSSYTTFGMGGIGGGFSRHRPDSLRSRVRRCSSKGCASTEDPPKLRPRSAWALRAPPQVCPQASGGLYSTFGAWSSPRHWPLQLSTGWRAWSTACWRCCGLAAPHRVILQNRRPELARRRSPFQAPGNQPTRHRPLAVTTPPPWRCVRSTASPWSATPSAPTAGALDPVESVAEQLFALFCGQGGELLGEPRRQILEAERQCLRHFRERTIRLTASFMAQIHEGPQGSTQAARSVRFQPARPRSNPHVSTYRRSSCGRSPRPDPQGA